MTSRQKIWTTSLWAVLVLCMVGVISAGLLKTQMPVGIDEAHASAAADVHTSPNPTADMHLPVPAFSLVDQDGKPVTDQSLHGNVWVTQFIFTHCAGPCPIISAKFEQLQAKLAGTPVKLLSISVDPDRDTPAVLKAWGERFHADFSRWTLLTGDKETCYKVSRSLLLAVLPETADTPLMHSTKFVLIDKAGVTRQMIDSLDDDSVDATAKAANALAAEPDK